MITPDVREDLKMFYDKYIRGFDVAFMVILVLGALGWYIISAFEAYILAEIVEEELFTFSCSFWGS